MARQIQLVKAAIEVYNPYVSMSLRFTVTTQNAVNMTGYIFKVIQNPVDPTQPTVVSVTYLGVCNPGDLANLPIGSPASPGQPYRVAFIDLTYNTETDANNAWQGIQDSTNRLIDALNAIDNLSSTTTVTLTG